MVAGATAGTVEHLAMFPMDTIKTRMQALPHGARARAASRRYAGVGSGGFVGRPAGGAAIGHELNYSSLARAVGTVLRLEGVRGLYRGVDAMALGAGPAHAFYFATYEARRGEARRQPPRRRPGRCIAQTPATLRGPPP